MTEWWAFKAIGTAFDKTRRILLDPFNAWTWLKLMIIVFFMGGGALRAGNMANYRIGPSDMKAYDTAISSILSNTTLLYILIGIIVLIFLVVLLLAYLRNVFSYVLINALTSGEVHVIKPFMENLGKGFRLFIFTLAAGLLMAVAIVCLLVPMVGGIIIGSGMGKVALILAILISLVLLIIMIALSILASIFIGFTYDFVAPMVYFKGMGIVESWKSLWASIKKDWQQYGVYVLSRWVLEFGVGIILMVILLPIMLIFIAALAIWVLGMATLVKASVVLAILAGLALLILIVALAIVMLAISMPVSVFFRYYSLDVLRQIDPSAVQYA